MNVHYPRNIVCLTEESVETLHLLGKLDLVKGVSIFVKRPEQATLLPKISQFTNSNIQKIVDLKPDLVLGFSDIQKDIAKELIGAGLNVFISNQRTVEEILSYILTLGSMLGAQNESRALVDQLKSKIDKTLQLTKNHYRPRVYFEEWDDPMITAIAWVSEIIEISGGKNIFAQKSKASLAKDRLVSTEEIVALNPEVILACWCGKKVKIQDFYQRSGWASLDALKNDTIFDLEPEVFLQPGPAPIIDGIDRLLAIFKQLNT
jgi:iron complex transport system substrate-binding protein